MTNPNAPRTPTPHYWGTEIRDTTNAVKDRYERQITVGDQLYGFVLDAYPADIQTYLFYGGMYDAGIDMVSAGAPFRAISSGGGGTLAELSQLHGGVELQTAALLNDAFYLETGGPTNPLYTYNVSEDVYYVMDFYLPSVADILVYMVLWSDANNYIGIRLNTAVDGNFYFVTRSGGAETITSLGAAGAAAWHRAYIRASTGNCWCVLDGANAVTHATDITTDNLGLYHYVETLDAGPALKTLRVRKTRALQDAAVIV
jgi:hypothetical protein